MTIHLPGRAAPASEISSELSRILADQAERDAAEVALHARNKEVLFDGLRLVGIAHVLVSFDGSGDSGQIESIEARDDLDQSVTLPAAQITFAGIDWQSGAPTERRLTLKAPSKNWSTTSSPIRIPAGRTMTAPMASSASMPAPGPSISSSTNGSPRPNSSPMISEGRRWHIRITTPCLR
jgi:hypothetical protein